MFSRTAYKWALVLGVAGYVGIFLVHGLANGPRPAAASAELAPVDLLKQSKQDVHRKSVGCVTCHVGSEDPHGKDTLHLGCCDCHGGDPTATTKEFAHVPPRFRDAWKTSGNPVRSYTLLNHETPEFIRFVNPGDLRIAHLSCGTTGCHQKEVLENRKSMMTHGCMLWSAALYNNGGVPFKWARYGESYSMNGVPQRVQTVPPPTAGEMHDKGVLPFLDPLPRYEISQPGNILRIFERGGRFGVETGIPERTEDPGRPRTRLSERGLGTKNRTDPVFIGLQKTRLLDPTLNFLGTNDHPGDYRSSGCTACHMIYANDRSPVHSGPYSGYGHRGHAAMKTDGFVTRVDPTIPKDEPGHPIAHRFTTAIPSSQCIVCHMHPGTNVLNSYLGYMWWDEETDGELLYPAKQKYPTAEEFIQAQLSNPNESAARTLYSDPEFLAHVRDLNPQARHTQFADFHGHGWVFRAVFKRDRHGHLLDHNGHLIQHAPTAQLAKAVKFPEEVKKVHQTEHDGKKAQTRIDQLKCEHDGTPVHLMDIHLEKGMHCIDCHFTQDSHGNSKLYGEVRAAVEIQCVDCHGTITHKATLKTSGPAAPGNVTKGAWHGDPKEVGRDLRALRTPFGKRRFEVRDGKIIQNSMVEKDLAWEIKQTADVINPRSEHYNQKAALAKTVRFEGDEMVWGDLPKDPKCVAHNNSNMSCITCHTAWNPSCFGCHLPQKANLKMPNLHNEGDVTRNYVSYNFQTLREDVFMLARDGNVTGNRIGPARSSCAIHVGSYNANRESIYVQQQTHSGEGLSGIAFSTNVPHTVRGGPPRVGAVKPGVHNHAGKHLKGGHETKTCTDCHLSRDNDNNAIMAQLLMHGTNYVNFMGRYCWVATGEHGLASVVVTERDEPQTVIGSSLHKLAFPDFFAKHLKHDRELQHAHEHPGKDISDNLLHPFRKNEVLSVQARGEYLYAACGEAGLRVFDIAFLDHKGFSERITTAPVSPFGQRFYVKTKYATSVAAPSTPAPDPTRMHRPENFETPVAALFGYLYVTDKYEGLILVGAGTLLDGNPLNNFLKREVTFNPDGLLAGAHSVTIVGNYAYVCCDAGLVIVGLQDPKKPVVKTVVGKDVLHHPKCVQVQFRYAFVCDKEGVKVLDVTNLEQPRLKARVELHDAHSIYVARTHAYVAGGKEGLVILDVENPERPSVYQVFNAGGCINDLHDVKLGITYTSQFAYLADGKNGLRVVQLTSPETPGNSGFSPRPVPELIATYKIPHGGHALAISKGLDRDRAVDESGNQIGVFGRVGARPLDFNEQRKMYWRQGKEWKVSDDPQWLEYHERRGGR